MAQCKTVKADGTRCGIRGGQVGAETGFCIWHDPARKDEAAKMRKKGLKRARRQSKSVRTVAAQDAPPAPKTLDDVVEWGSWAVRAVATGEIDARTADSISKLCNTLERAISKATLQEEIRNLRAQVDEYDSKRAKQITAG